jgi:diguanylate cyclase (GGDEF)-like protein/PAS domain S-box-containing protein
MLSTSHDPEFLLQRALSALPSDAGPDALCSAATLALRDAGIDATLVPGGVGVGDALHGIDLSGDGAHLAWLVPETSRSLDGTRLATVCQALATALGGRPVSGRVDAPATGLDGHAPSATALLEDLPDGYYQVDLEGRPLFMNAAFGRIIGVPPEELPLRDASACQTEAMAAHLASLFERVRQEGAPAQCEAWQYRRRDGSTVQVEGSIQLLNDAQGRLCGFHGVVRDVTERLRVEEALRESEARFRALTSISSDYYWEQDAEHRLVHMENRHAETDEMQRAFLGKPIWDGPVVLYGQPDWHEHHVRLEARAPFRDVVLQGRQPDGRSYFVSVSGEPMHDEAGRFRGYRGVSRDITAQKLAEARAQHIAMHDGLTGLPNRRMFLQLLKGAVATSARYERRFAVLFVDLDRFKFINDTLGHEAGDTLLKEIAARFTAALRTSDVLARLGGDEFVILALEVADAEQAGAVARKLLEAASKPIRLGGQDCRISASIGVALYPDDGIDEQMLMKNADIAMYVAKDDGKNTYQMFSTEINSQSMERLNIENGLRHALERQEFTLHYQAKLDLRGSGISGVEALLRWRSPELGDVSPSRFIPVAEESGIIVAIGRWVLRAACMQAVAWQAQGLPPIRVAVNISARQFGDVELLQDVERVLAESGLDPALLELEITEGMLIHDTGRAIAVMTAIKKLGVRLAIDDFGTGYSSLGQLKDFPIDTLKVDRSFIRDLATNSQDKAIASAIIAMGRTLSMTVVAEGVETLEQQEFLRDQACDEMQGFYFSRPISAEELAELLRANPHLAGAPRAGPLN